MRISGFSATVPTAAAAFLMSTAAMAQQPTPQQPAPGAQQEAPATQQPGIFTEAQTRGFQEWTRGVQAAGLQDRLAERAHTVFIADDAAYQEVPAGQRQTWQTDPTAQRAALGHTIVEGRFTLDELRQREYLTTIDGQRLPVRVEGDHVFIGDAVIREGDIEAGTGMIHAVDRVTWPQQTGEMQPPGQQPAPAAPQQTPAAEYPEAGSPQQMTGAQQQTPGVQQPTAGAQQQMPDAQQQYTQQPGIFTEAQARGYQEWTRGVEATGLRDRLAASPHTAFIADDAAYQQVPGGQLQTWQTDPAAQRAAFGHTIVEGRLTMDELRQRQYVTTIDGQRVPVRVEEDRVWVGDAVVREGDIAAGTGMIHTVDRVTWPQ